MPPRSRRRQEAVGLEGNRDEQGRAVTAFQAQHAPDSVPPPPYVGGYGHVPMMIGDRPVAADVRRRWDWKAIAMSRVGPSRLLMLGATPIQSQPTPPLPFHSRPTHRYENSD